MKTAVIIASRDAALLDLCLRAHERFTPAEVRFVVIDTSVFTAVEGVCADAEARGLCVQYEWATPAAPTYSAWSALGARWAIYHRPDLLVFANDDAIVMPDWLPTMEEDLAILRGSGHRPGLLGASSNCISGPQACIGAGGRRWNGPIMVPRPVPTIFTFFAAVERAAYEAVGGWDLDNPAHCGGDDILSYRLRSAGFTNAISRAFVAHFGSESFVGAKVDRAADQRAARDYIRAKYPGMGVGA